MKRRKTIIGICILWALALGALAAQGARAQTPYTCVPVTGKALGTKGFKDAHCKEAAENTVSTPEVVKFEHEEVKPGTETASTLTNVTTGTEKAILKLKSVQSGVTLELQSTEITGTGHTQGVEEGGVMFWGWRALIWILHHTTVTVPIGKGCIVVGGEIVTNNLSATTKGLTNELKFSPETGETFAEFTVSGCSVMALNHTYTLKGSVKGKTEGATIVFTHSGTTEQKTLTLSGQNAGLEGSLTPKGENGNGLALT